jgi:hypothetical protein
LQLISRNQKDLTRITLSQFHLVSALWWAGRRTSADVARIRRGITRHRYLSTPYFVSLRSLLPGGSRPVPAQDLNIRAIAPVMLLLVAVALPTPAISQVKNP